MAGLVDDVLEDTLEVSSLDDMLDTQQAPEPESSLPEKYRNKSLNDIIAMHQEAEKLIGRQGGEVGDLRRTVDEFIKTQTLKNSDKQEVAEEDYFVDPQKAIDSRIEKHPSVMAAKQASQDMQRSAIRNKIIEKYPDAGHMAENPEFMDWIKSSTIRSELFNRAANQFDFDSADELLSNWETKKGVTNKITETSKIDRDNQLKAADIGTRNSSESVAKKKYRRSDIIKLMQTDPDRYDSMSNEIMAAYRDGRVI